MMKTLPRPAVLAAGIVVLAWIGWYALQATRADFLARTDADAALRMDPAHPQALLAASRRALAEGNWERATALADQLLQRAPGRGQAFGVIALAAAEEGRKDAAELLSVATQRARRDRDVRAAAAATAMRAGDLPEAMAELDALLRIGPRNGGQLYEAMAQQAGDPRFAKALVDTLSVEPPPRWRDHFLASLGAKGRAAAMDRVYAGLQLNGDLSVAEIRRWLDRMRRDGRWGEAYAQWIGTLGDLQHGVEAVHNGDFESVVTDLGFDWRRESAQGVFTEVVDDPAGQGRVAHIHFIGRPSANGDLAHPVLLGPGKYHLSLRARGEYLRSEQGLDWVVRCSRPNPTVIARVQLDRGSFAWREFSAEFVVPASECPGQWLRLENPATKGLAQQVSGDLWVDDVRIVALDEPGAQRMRGH